MQYIIQIEKKIDLLFIFIDPYFDFDGEIISNALFSLFDHVTDKFRTCEQVTTVSISNGPTLRTATVQTDCVCMTKRMNDWMNEWINERVNK